jgi:hypothetical protein
MPQGDDFACGACGDHAHAVFVAWPGGDGPELHEILGREAERFVAPPQRGQCVFGQNVMRMLRMQRTQQDIRIGEDHRLQSAITVNGFAAYIFIRQQREIICVMAMHPPLELSHPFLRLKVP